MSYQRKQAEYAAQCRAHITTGRRWIRKSAPLDDPEKVEAFIAAERSRRGVSKFARRILPTPEPLTIAPVTATEFDVAHDLSAIEGTDGPGMLARLVSGEELAYQRYIESGGSERLAQIWLVTCDQRRKAETEAAKHKTDATQAETKTIGAVLELLGDL